MTNRISHSAEGMKLKQEKREWTKTHQAELCDALMQENFERMQRISANFMKHRDYERYKRDLDKQEKFMTYRVESILLGDENKTTK